MKENIIKTDIKTGLTSTEVKERKKAGRTNNSLGKTSKSVGEILADNIFTFFNLVNFILAGLLIYVGSYRNLLFIGIVIANIFIGIFQELKAKQKIDKLTLLTRAGVNVIRDGFEQNIPDKELVEDEIIVLSAGQQIPVDAILLSGSLEVNESLLTGESNPILKEQNDKLLSGSFVISGKGKAYVTNVGKDSYSGKLSLQAKKYKEDRSEIQSSLNTIIYTIAFLLVPIGLIMYFKEFYLLDISFKETIISVSGALISLIPSGLVVLTSTVFVVGVLKLSRKNTLIQNMSATETLARVDTLCLDKTGTITEGELNLIKILPLDNYSEAYIKKILKTLVTSLEDQNPTINAIRKAAQNYTEQPINNITHIIPFSSARKYSGLSFHEKKDGTFILGAGNFIFGEEFEKYSSIIQKYVDEGDRVLTLAESVKKTNDFNLPDDLKPIAFLIFSDIIRKEAPQTLDYFEDQGVNLKIISGDDAKTASIIAKRAGLDTYNNYIDATKLKTKEDIDKNIEKYSVFGRVTPEQKKDFISSLKEKGHTVAMVGDGVNDVLALKEANTSIAMASGSDASRSVASLVLLDSNFASLPSVISEGRQIINNLEKSASLYLSKTTYSLLTVFLYLFLSLSYVFAPIQLTLLNSVTIGIPSVVLALQPNDDLVEGKFFTNVLFYALPAGLTAFTGIILATIFTSIFSFWEESSTIALLSILFVGYMQIYKLSVPFNFLRKCLMVFIVTLFFVAYIFFNQFFFLVYLNFAGIIITFVIYIVEFILYSYLSKPKRAEKLATRTTNLIDKLSKKLNFRTRFQKVN